MSNENVETAGSSEPRRFLAFSLGGEEYALPLVNVKEVIAVPEITHIPQTPSHFLGIMNLRGQVIPIIDLRLKFRMSKADAKTETAVVILDLSPLCLGIVVDSVDSVLAIKQHEISPRPEVESKTDNDYILGVARKENKLVILLDIAKSLDVADLAFAGNQNTQQKTAA